MVGGGGKGKQTANGKAALGLFRPLGYTQSHGSLYFLKATQMISFWDYVKEM